MIRQIRALFTCSLPGLPGYRGEGQWHRVGWRRYWWGWWQFAKIHRPTRCLILGEQKTVWTWDLGWVRLKSSPDQDGFDNGPWWCNLGYGWHFAWGGLWRLRRVAGRVYIARRLDYPLLGCIPPEE